MPRCFRAVASRNTLVAAIAAAVLAPPASAHVDATPTFLREGQPQTVQLAVHNDREIPMSALQVAVPEGIEIRELAEVTGWVAQENGNVASWTGGEVGGDADQEFGLSLEALGEPRPVTLALRQRYPDGESVQATVALTVVPGAEDEGVDGVSIGIVVVGLILAGLGVVLALRRLRAAPDDEHGLG